MFNSKNKNTNEVQNHAELQSQVDNLKEHSFSNEEVKESLQNYFDFESSFLNSSEDVMKFLFDDAIIYSEHFDDGQRSYMKTNKTYSEFKEKVLSYISENKLAESNSFRNIDGILYIGVTGASGGRWKVESIEKIDKNLYKGVTTWMSDGPEETVVFEFSINEYKGKCVIDSCKSIDDNEKNWTIKGSYFEPVEAGDPDSYTFYGNEVICNSLVYTFYGDFEIKDDTIKITHKKAYNLLDQKEDNSELEYRKNEEITIIDDNTLMYRDSKLVKDNSFDNITLSGHYAEDGTDVGWEFTKNGKVAICVNVSVLHGEYKTIDEDGIEVHYTKNEIYDDDGNVSYEEVDSYEYYRLSDKKSNDKISIFSEETCNYFEITRFGEAVNIKE